MSVTDALRLAGAKPAGKRPYFLKDPDVERVMAITMAVAGEVAVLRQRLDTVERLLDEKGTISRADIEAYKPDQTASDERGLWLDEYLARIMRIIQQEAEAIKNPNEPSSGDVADLLSK